MNPLHTTHLLSPLISSCSSFALNILIQSTGIISRNPMRNALITVRDEVQGRGRDEGGRGWGEIKGEGKGRGEE
jgi:hypothetical protein